MKIYFINPLDWTRQKAFGYFKYEPCECGCTKTFGWGFNFFIIGIRFDKR